MPPSNRLPRRRFAPPRALPGGHVTQQLVPDFITAWKATLPSPSLASLMTDSSTVGYISTDMIIGFCSQGPLASERVGSIVPAVVSLAERYHALGGRDFVFLQDTHHPSAPEFESWPVHCVAGSIESEMVPELKVLPFANLFTIFPKNSLHPALDTGFDRWLAGRPHLKTLLVVGNCTDLCVYTLAMHLRLHHNAHNIPDVRVIVPADAVDTYDLPVAATPPGVFAHPGDFFHDVFLYHMALNGVEVVRALA
jgi:nicotinamidase-related amidase